MLQVPNPHLSLELDPTGLVVLAVHGAPEALVARMVLVVQMVQAAPGVLVFRVWLQHRSLARNLTLLVDPVLHGVLAVRVARMVLVLPAFPGALVVPVVQTVPVVQMVPTILGGLGALVFLEQKPMVHGVLAPSLPPSLVLDQTVLVALAVLRSLVSLVPRPHFHRSRRSPLAMNRMALEVLEFLAVPLQSHLARDR